MDSKFGPVKSGDTGPITAPENAVGCTVGWRDFIFLEFKNRHPLMDSCFNSKTKIEKAFFDILRN